MINKSEQPSGVTADELIRLLAKGLEATKGAQVIMNAYFERVNRDPYNNDNYCRLQDWMVNVQQVLKKQSN